jgi:pimeloyl-ACP methyl ester carboxylesterase
MGSLSRRRFIQGSAGASLFLAGCAMAAAGIDESGFVRIGGIDQWVAIQGRDQRNPVILYLHGGPGEAQSPFLQTFLPWQRDFTVVNWDQRGSGKTFGRHGASTPDMTFDRLVDDAIEIAEHVRTRFTQRKVILVGQSCGSLLGVHAIKRRPDLFHAYVGTGQVVSINATMGELAQWARQKATETGDTITLEALDKAASLSDPDRQMALRRASGKWAISAPDQLYVKMVTDFKGPKPYPAIGDVADWINGVGFTSSGDVARTMISMDLHTLGLDVPIPFFIVQGREDHIAGIEPGRAYVEGLRAPAKAFMPIDGGHYACFTNADAFIATLRRNVRPLAV